MQAEKIWLDSSRPALGGNLEDDYRLKNYFLIYDVLYKGKPIVAQLAVPASDNQYETVDSEIENQSSQGQKAQPVVTRFVNFDLNFPDFDNYIPMQHLGEKRWVDMANEMTITEHLQIMIDVLLQELELIKQKSVILIDRHNQNIMIARDQKTEEYYPVHIDVEYLFDINNMDVLGPNGFVRSFFAEEIEGNIEKAHYEVIFYVFKGFFEILKLVGDSKNNFLAERLRIIFRDTKYDIARAADALIELKSELEVTNN